MMRAAVYFMVAMGWMESVDFKERVCAAEWMRKEERGKKRERTVSVASICSLSQHRLCLHVPVRPSRALCTASETVPAKAVVILGREERQAGTAASSPEYIRGSAVRV